MTSTVLTLNDEQTLLMCVSVLKLKTICIFSR